MDHHFRTIDPNDVKNKSTLLDDDIEDFSANLNTIAGDEDKLIKTINLSKLDSKRHNYLESEEEEEDKMEINSENQIDMELADL
jgi:hypothetical protein